MSIYLWLLTYLCLPYTYFYLPKLTYLPKLIYLPPSTYQHIPTYDNLQSSIYLSLPIPKYRYIIVADPGRTLPKTINTEITCFSQPLLSHLIWRHRAPKVLYLTFLYKKSFLNKNQSKKLRRTLIDRISS